MMKSRRFELGRAATRASTSTIVGALLLHVSVGVLTAPGAWATIPTRQEPEYFDAVQSYNNKNYADAVHKIDDLLKKSPGQVEYLQLKALSLKSAGREKEATVVYENLIKTAKSPKEAAPYHFELGMVHYKDNKPEAAREHLRQAASQGFNEGAANFFLGNIAFKENSLPEADEAFGRVLSSDANDLKPIARFYLGQIAMKSGNSSAGVQNLLEARNSAREMAENPASSPDTRKVAEQIQSTSTAALAPLDRNSWFGTVSLSTGYDSNVLAVPASAGQSESGATGTSSPRGTLGASVGYLSSPLRTIQFVPSYRTNLLYNTNAETRTGNSWAHQASLYVTRKPLAPTNFGLKLEGDYLFQNVANETGSGSSLKPYSFTWLAGPYAKTQVGRNNSVGADLSFGHTSNFQDDKATDNLKRSGNATQARVFFRRDTGAFLFNPGVALAYIHNAAKGTEWQSNTESFELSDAMVLSSKWSAIGSANYALSSYANRTPSRKDKTLTLVAGLSRKFSSQLSGNVELQVYRNASNIPETYEYNRFVSSVGATYGF